MLVKYTRPNIHFFGNLKFTPGLNKIDRKVFDKTLTPHQKKHYKLMKDQGIFEEIKETASVTAKMVKETADLSLLEAQEGDKTIKGPVKTAIRKQITEIRSVEDALPDAATVGEDL